MQDSRVLPATLKVAERPPVSSNRGGDADGDEALSVLQNCQCHEALQEGLLVVGSSPWPPDVVQSASQYDMHY